MYTACSYLKIGNDSMLISINNFANPENDSYAFFRDDLKNSSSDNKVDP